MIHRLILVKVVHTNKIYDYISPRFGSILSFNILISVQFLIHQVISIYYTYINNYCYIFVDDTGSHNLSEIIRMLLVVMHRRTRAPWFTRLCDALFHPFLLPPPPIHTIHVFVHTHDYCLCIILMLTRLRPECSFLSRPASLARHLHPAGCVRRSASVKGYSRAHPAKRICARLTAFRTHSKAVDAFTRSFGQTARVLSDYPVTLSYILLEFFTGLIVLDRCVLSPLMCIAK